MFFDKKRSVSGIMSLMDKDGRRSEVNLAPESGEHNEYTAMAEELLSAAQNNSVNQLASMLKSFHEMIAEADEEQDMEG